MSGKEESKTPTITERHEKIVALAKEYPESLGLRIQIPSDAQEYLDASTATRRKMDAEECGNAAIVLAQLATYIQLETNRMQADMNWCDNAIDFLVANIIHTCGNKYTPFPYKRKIAIKNNDVAKKLSVIISNIQVRTDSLNYLPSHLKAVASAYGDLQQTKRSQRA